MEIRTAQRQDIPELIELGMEFAINSSPVHGFSVSRLRITEFVNEMVDNDKAVVLVLSDNGIIRGFIAGIVQWIFFSEDVALQEVAWYVRRGYRGISLLFDFELYAVKAGCNKIVVGNKPAYFDLQGFYERHNYKLLENQYVKHLEVG